MVDVAPAVDSVSGEFVSPLVVAALEEKIRDVIGAALVAGSNVTLTVNDAGDTITIAASASGGGFSFTDPNADRIGFWDDSAGAFAPLTHTAPLTISGDTLSILAASASNTGVVELATSAETITGTDISRAVTPAGLQAKVASETASGIVELATTTEATTGTDTTRAVTPAGVKAVADTKLNTADAAELIRDTMGTALVAGSNVTITVNDAGDTITIAASGSGAAWGGITGTLSSQTDLQSALDGKAATFTVGGRLTLGGGVLNAAAASTTQEGAAELTTSAEAVAGTDTTRAMTADAHRDTWGLYYGVNAQTGTAYAPVLDDMGKLVTCTNAAAITVTLPSNTTTAFPVGTQIDFAVLGAGMVTFVAGSGATANGTPSLVTRAQYSAATAIKVSTNGWIVVGDLA